MDSSIDLNLRTSRLKRTPPPGSVPGTFFISEDALPPKISIYSYNKEIYFEEAVSSIDELKNHFEKYKGMQHWVDVKGIGDQNILEGLASFFSIHKLVIADVVNVYQRPKMEEHEEHLYIVSRMMYQNNEGEFINEQVSIFLGKDYVMSIQERYDNILNPVRERLVSGKGFLRGLKADFIAYAIVDAILDTFFPLLEKFGDYLDDLEQDIIKDIPKKKMMFDIQQTKRELIIIRRTSFQNRDMVNDMLRTTTPFISANTKLFIRDAYDHNIQVMDIVESYKEVASSLMEIYLSSTNIRMNEIMKILAVISTIFIPLTFIVGIYGMNFQEIDPVTGAFLRWNMPELYSPYGYLVVSGIMAVLFFGSLFYFFKKGWLGKE